jgi:hypothetical protein
MGVEKMPAPERPAWEGGCYMKKVVWIDENGYKRCSEVRDNDPDSLAKSGIPCDPPNIEEIDWDAVKRDLHNLLLERGLTSWQEINRSQGHIKSAIQDVLYRRLIALYRQKDNSNAQSMEEKP